jgi:hypothetical protein
MAKRWYLSPIIGSGSADDPYRAAVADVLEGGWHSAVIPIDQLTGRPLSNVALALVSKRDHRNLEADGRFEAVGDHGALDAALPAPARAELRGRLTARGVAAGLGASATTPRQMVRSLGRALMGPAWTERGTNCRDDD